MKLARLEFHKVMFSFLVLNHLEANYHVHKRRAFDISPSYRIVVDSGFFPSISRNAGFRIFPVLLIITNLLMSSAR